MKPFCSLLIVTAIAVGCSAQFDRGLVGVAYSPYTDNIPGRNWDQYSLDDIKSDLSQIRNTFSSISTYSMGTAGYNNGKPWDQCDSNALIARAAAQLNQQGGQRLSVNIGTYQMANDGDQTREINNAFEAAADANRISANTVTGITFTNEYITNAWEADRVIGMINANKNRGFRVGARTHICGHILGGDLNEKFRQLALASHFIYCNVYPSNEHAQLPPEQAAANVVGYFTDLRRAFNAVNPNLEVMIGETGWPSEGNSFNNSPNSPDYLKRYWRQINKSAVENGVKVQLFEAIDEPWKSANSNFKAEGHYGWWWKNGRQLNEK